VDSISIKSSTKRITQNEGSRIKISLVGKLAALKNKNINSSDLLYEEGQSHFGGRGNYFIIKDSDGNEIGIYDIWTN